MKNYLLWAFIFIVGVMARPGSGLTVRSGPSVDIPAGTVIDDDLIAFGRQVNIKGKVNGDLIAFAQQVSVDGEITGSIVSAGSTVEIRAASSRSVWAAGGNVQVSGIIANNVLLFGGTLLADQAAQIGKDLIAFGGQFNLAGAVGRQVRGGVGTLNLTGKVGSVDLNSDETNIGAAAEINGDLVIRGEKAPVIAPGAKIAGEQKFIAAAQAKKSRGPRLPIFKILMFLASLLVGCILIALSSRFTRRIMDALIKKPWQSLGVGFAVLVGGPVAIAILLMIMVGIPLSIFGVFLYLTLFYVSSIFVGLVVGERVIRFVRKTGDISQYASLVLGMAVLFLVGMIPWIGFIVKLATVIFGMGMVAVGHVGLMKEAKENGLL